MKLIPKRREEIEAMRINGGKLAQIKEELKKLIRPGVTPVKVDKRADELILSMGGKPSFKMVKGYQWATCININDGVVHGIPNRISFKEGDVVSVDVGMFYKGFHTDSAFTVPVGEVTAQVLRFLDAGSRALEESILKARTGNFVSDISQAMESVLGSRGCSPIRDLTGHGVGRKLHEAPAIPCFWEKGMRDFELPSGATIAIEVIYAAGQPDWVCGADGWTISTKDGRLAALLEETVVVGKDSCEVLTRLMA